MTPRFKLANYQVLHDTLGLLCWFMIGGLCAYGWSVTP